MDAETRWANQQEWDEEDRLQDPYEDMSQEDLIELLEDSMSQKEILRASNTHYIRRCCELQEEIKRLEHRLSIIENIAKFFSKFFRWIKSDILKKFGI